MRKKFHQSCFVPASAKRTALQPTFKKEVIFIMYGTSVLLLTIVVTSVQGFFFLLEKKQAFYCSKVCPLYCPDMKDMDKPDEKRTRRHAGYEYYEPEIYEDFPPYIDADDFEEFSYHFYPRFHHKKTTSTTTTQKPTTTEEPTLICQVCKKKCKD